MYLKLHYRDGRNSQTKYAARLSEIAGTTSTVLIRGRRPGLHIALQRMADSFTITRESIQMELTHLCTLAKLVTKTLSGNGIHISVAVPLLETVLESNVPNHHRIDTVANHCIER